MSEFISIPLAIVVVIVLLGLAFWSRYKTVSSDQAMIVTGSFLGKHTSHR